ncbi:MAG: leucyl/phenylalanyl-tRNA--protein transferase [Burkholderiaceae bacterium]
MSADSAHQIPRWVEPGEPLPDPLEACRAGQTDSPNTDSQQLWPAGLLAAGHDLSAERLIEAYRMGLFPWYSEGQPVLWWSPDPRMVLMTDQFKLRRSLVKTIRQWRRSRRYRVTLNHSFAAVMNACAAPRENQDGTWITPEMFQAYNELHQLGNALSVEIWRLERQHAPLESAELIGGLYGVSIGRMFFGESMFALERDASKIALASLVDLLRRHHMPMLDCQQNTGHLASLGAREITRDDFLCGIKHLVSEQSPDWSSMSIEFPSV